MHSVSRFNDSISVLTGNKVLMQPHSGDDICDSCIHCVYTRDHFNVYLVYTRAILPSKYFLHILDSSTSPGYDQCLSPPKSKSDICFSLSLSSSYKIIVIWIDVSSILETGECWFFDSWYHGTLPCVSLLVCHQKAKFKHCNRHLYSFVSWSGNYGIAHILACFVLQWTTRRKMHPKGASCYF